MNRLLLLAIATLGTVGLLSAQQPNGPSASMVWGGYDGPGWPIQAEVWSNAAPWSSLTVEMSGTPLQGYTITHTPAGLLPTGLASPFGTIDQDLSGGLDILFDGLFAGAGSFPGQLAVLGLGGTSTWSFPLLDTATFALPGLQSIVGDPGSAFGLVLSAATSLQVMPWPHPCVQTVGGDLPLGDDSTVSVSVTGGVIRFFGVTYNAVEVNSNGNLTFGTGDLDFSPTSAEFVSGPPRIAPLWHDFAPNLGGTVQAAQVGNTLYVSWVEVPAFGCAGSSNTFCCRIDVESSSPVGAESSFSFEYAGLAPCATTGGGAIIVGCGPGAAGAGHFGTDLSVGQPRGPILYTCGPFTQGVIDEGYGVLQSFVDSSAFDLGPSFGGPTTLQFTPAVNTDFDPLYSCDLTQRWYTVTAIP